MAWTVQNKRENFELFRVAKLLQEFERLCCAGRADLHLNGWEALLIGKLGLALLWAILANGVNQFSRQEKRTHICPGGHRRGEKMIRNHWFLHLKCSNALCQFLPSMFLASRSGEDFHYRKFLDLIRMIDGLFLRIPPQFHCFLNAFSFFERSSCYACQLFLIPMREIFFRVPRPPEKGLGPSSKYFSPTKELSGHLLLGKLSANERVHNKFNFSAIEITSSIDIQ